MNLSFLETGDLLFFEGKGPVSTLIKIFTDSNVSHVGMVWKCPITCEFYIWEIGDVTYDNSFPIITRKNVPLDSAHLVPLSVKCKNFKKIYVRKLVTQKLTKKEKNELFIKLDTFIALNIGKKYTKNLVSLFTKRCNSTFISLSFMEEEEENLDDPKHSEWMCSQLTILTLYYLGIISSIDSHSSCITPGDMLEDIVCSKGFYFKKPKQL